MTVTATSITLIHHYHSSSTTANHWKPYTTTKNTSSHDGTLLYTVPVLLLSGRTILFNLLRIKFRVFA